MASTARTTRNRQRRANRREPRLFPDFQPVSCRPVCRLPGAVCDADSAEWWCGDPFCFSVAEIRSLKWWSCLTSRSLVVDLPLKRGTRLDQNDPFCTPRKKKTGLVSAAKLDSCREAWDASFQFSGAMVSFLQQPLSPSSKAFVPQHRSHVRHHLSLVSHTETENVASPRAHVSNRGSRLNADRVVRPH